MTTQRRAKIGGEIGANGEFYKGGAFISTTNNPKLKKRKSSGKVQIEPYKWVFPEEGFKSLFTSNYLACMDWREYYSTGIVKVLYNEIELYVLDSVQVKHFCQQYAKGYRFYYWSDRGWIFKK